jgi:hypothetical protein
MIVLLAKSSEQEMHNPPPACHYRPRSSKALKGAGPGKLGTHDNLRRSKRNSLPFHRRNRIYDSADRGSRKLSFLNIGELFLLRERQEMRMKHVNRAEFPGCSGGSDI